MKVIIFIVLIFIVLYLLYKFYYHNMRHINVKKNLYVDLTYKVKNMNNEYPNYLFETYYDKSVIPLKIQENRKKYANKFIRYVFEDNDIVHFLSTQFGEKAVDKFYSLHAGAHKADFWRYCILYIYGGIYIDIKTELIEDLDVTFPDKNRVYFVVSMFKDHIYNGVIVIPPQHIIMKEMILIILNTPSEVINKTYFWILKKHLVPRGTAVTGQLGLGTLA